jgi:hypothetical protein
LTKWRQSRKIPRVAKNFPFRDPVERRKVDRDSLASMLLTFEDAWAQATGNRITSTEFYERYASGEFDSTLAMAWASHVEMYRQHENAADRAVVDPLALASC